MALNFFPILLGIYRILEKNSQEFRSKTLNSMIFKAFYVVYQRLNVYLILAQKFSNFFLGLYRTIEIFGNFLRITHQIISPICLFYSFLGLLMITQNSQTFL